MRRPPGAVKPQVAAADIYRLKAADTFDIPPHLAQGVVPAAVVGRNETDPAPLYGQKSAERKKERIQLVKKLFQNIT